MNTIQTYARYVEWLSPDQMHQSTKEWLSDLLFLKDEHLFFEDLIKSYTLQLIAPEKFSHNKEIIDAINKSEKQNNLLIKAVKDHKNKLEIMLDGINQINEEKAYKDSHRRLINEINEFQKHYKILKTQLFEIIKAIKKEDKQNHLLDNR